MLRRPGFLEHHIKTKSFFIRKVIFLNGAEFGSQNIDRILALGQFFAAFGGLHGQESAMYFEKGDRELKQNRQRSQGTSHHNIKLILIVELLGPMIEDSDVLEVKLLHDFRQESAFFGGRLDKRHLASRENDGPD